MSRYRLRRWVFATEVDIPDNAIGVTLTAHGDGCEARWLEPVKVQAATTIHSLNPSPPFPEPHNSKWDHPWGGDG